MIKIIDILSIDLGSLTIFKSLKTMITKIVEMLKHSMLCTLSSCIVFYVLLLPFSWNIFHVVINCKNYSTYEKKYSQAIEFVVK